MTDSVIPAFATGKVGRDQIADYAKRKGWTLEEAERWLASVVGYKRGNLMTEVQKLAQVLQDRYGSVQKQQEYGWPQSSQNVIDCVLSLNRRYEEFVKPRVEEFGKNNVQTLAELRVCVLGFPSPEEFSIQKLNYKDRTRAETLLGVVEYLLDAQFEHKGQDEKQKLAQWATWARPGDYLTLGVRGFGLAGFQYLRMLFGAQTTKPDVHIIRFVSEVLERQVTGVQALTFLERAAKLANLPLREVDGEIWRERALR